MFGTHQLVPEGKVEAVIVIEAPRMMQVMMRRGADPFENWMAGPAAGMKLQPGMAHRIAQDHHDQEAESHDSRSRYEC
jgi:hypothetical protein